MQILHIAYCFLFPIFLALCLLNFDVLKGGDSFLRAVHPWTVVNPIRRKSGIGRGTDRSSPGESMKMGENLPKSPKLSVLKRILVPLSGSAGERIADGCILAVQCPGLIKLSRQ